MNIFFSIELMNKSNNTPVPKMKSLNSFKKSKGNGRSQKMIIIKVIKGVRKFFRKICKRRCLTALTPPAIKIIAFEEFPEKINTGSSRVIKKTIRKEHEPLTEYTTNTILSTESLAVVSELCTESGLETTPEPNSAMLYLPEITKLLQDLDKNGINPDTVDKEISNFIYKLYISNSPMRPQNEMHNTKPKLDIITRVDTNEEDEEEEEEEKKEEEEEKEFEDESDESSYDLSESEFFEHDEPHTPVTPIGTPLGFHNVIYGHDESPSTPTSKSKNSKYHVIGSECPLPSARIHKNVNRRNYLYIDKQTGEETLNFDPLTSLPPYLRYKFEGRKLKQQTFLPELTSELAELKSTNSGKPINQY